MVRSNNTTVSIIINFIQLRNENKTILNEIKHQIRR